MKYIYEVDYDKDHHGRKRHDNDSLMNQNDVTFIKPVTTNLVNGQRVFKIVIL